MEKFSVDSSILNFESSNSIIIENTIHSQNAEVKSQIYKTIFDSNALEGNASVVGFSFKWNTVLFDKLLRPIEQGSDKSPHFEKLAISTNS